MAFYKRMGILPRKRHTAFRKEDGSLYREQVMGTKGFSGIQSILYHHHLPTAVKKVEWHSQVEPDYDDHDVLRHRHFYTNRLAETGDMISGRQYMLGNEDLQIAVCRPTEQMNYFYRNVEGDELIFFHEGSGTVETLFGSLSYGKGDYLIIPIGTIYRIIPSEGASKCLVVESKSMITTPGRYRNEFGQLLEHSPFCERDIRGPEVLTTHVEKGEFEVRTKSGGSLHAHWYQHHPFDVIGWDGFLYPWIFNIDDFEPITGRIHMPPPIHQTFEGRNFVVCSFVPRLYDYHPDAVPAPYFHSNVNSDEVLYYVAGNFMSRKGIEEGSITLHPAGLPHGPHPGKIEASIGKKETRELAVMIDTFRPLKVVNKVKIIEDEGYAYSWAE